jgi:2-keto-3-deoxy-6-phosphogluconate aldolase
MNNIADYLKIAVIAFAGVWLINHALTAAGLPQYKA